MEDNCNTKVTWKRLLKGEMFGDICEIIGKPYWCDPCLFTQIQHILIVTVAKTFKLGGWIDLTIFWWIVFHKDVFADLESIFGEISRLANNSISKRVKRMVKKVTVAGKKGALNAQLEKLLVCKWTLHNKEKAKHFSTKKKQQKNWALCSKSKCLIFKTLCSLFCLKGDWESFRKNMKFSNGLCH